MVSLEYCSKVDSLLDGLNAPPLVGQVERLENQGERSVVAAHPLDRGLEVQETALLDGRGEFRAEAGRG